MRTALNKLSNQNVYLDYIKEHVRNVQSAFQTMFVDRKEELLSKFSRSNDLEDSIEAVGYEIKHHDDSKFSDKEFEGYRRKFYPVGYEMDSEEQRQITEEMFQDAWKHHYTHNDHHPDYWLTEDGKPDDMSLPAIVHMLSDWGGMCIKFGGTPKTYYYEKAKEEKSKMTEETKKIVEELLDIIYP